MPHLRLRTAGDDPFSRGLGETSRGNLGTGARSAPFAAPLPLPTRVQCLRDRESCF